MKEFKWKSYTLKEIFERDPFLKRWYENTRKNIEKFYGIKEDD